MDAVFVDGVSKDDLDLEAVRRYMRKAVREGRRNYSEDEDPWSVLKKLEWVKSETEITRAAYLLFAKYPQRKFSQAVLHAGAFKADGAVIYDSHDSMGNVQDQVEDALNFVKKSIRCAIVVTGKAEDDRHWEYPVEAIREAIANAVCHRDYSIGNDIQIKVFEDRVVITNPGQHPCDMTLEDLDNPDHSSRPRNKLPAQAFYDMHIIEHYGSGVRRMRKECDNNGSPYPVWTSEKGEFCIRFPARTMESAAKLGIDLAKLGLDLGLDFGGWAPHGWIAEDGTIPWGVIVPHRNRTRGLGGLLCAFCNGQDARCPSAPPRSRRSQSTPPSRQCRSGSHRRKSFKKQAKTSYQGKNDVKRAVFGYTGMKGCRILSLFWHTFCVGKVTDRAIGFGL